MPGPLLPAPPPAPPRPRRPDQVEDPAKDGRDLRLDLRLELARHKLEVTALLVVVVGVEPTAVHSTVQAHFCKIQSCSKRAPIMEMCKDTGPPITTSPMTALESVQHNQHFLCHRQGKAILSIYNPQLQDQPPRIAGTFSVTVYLACLGTAPLCGSLPGILTNRLWLKPRCQEVLRADWRAWKVGPGAWLSSTGRCRHMQPRPRLTAPARPCNTAVIEEKQGVWCGVRGGMRVYYVGERWAVSAGAGDSRQRCTAKWSAGSESLMRPLGSAG